MNKNLDGNLRKRVNQIVNNLVEIKPFKSNNVSFFSSKLGILMHGYAQKLDEKSELINKNMSVVKKIAYYYLGRVHQVVEVEDLLQIGMVGLD